LKRLTTAGLVLVALPAIALAFLMFRYGVDVPYSDQWWVIGLSEAFHLHVLTFAQLFAQFNEHRLFFPRLLLLGIDALAHGNVKYELMALWLAAAVVLWNVYRLARLTLQANGVRLLTVTTLSSFLIFSPIQHQNWLWGNQISVLTPIVCLTTALAISYTSRNSWLAFWVAAMLATVASFSIANGLLCWPLLLPVQLHQFKGKPGRARAAFLWLALMAVNLAAFFYNYRFLGTRPSVQELLTRSDLVIVSFFGFLGAPLSFGTGIDEERLAHYVGAAILLVAMFVCLRFIETARQPGMVRRCLPWLTIAAYALASAVIVTLGRATSSSQRLLESRYTSFSVYLFMALVFLWLILFLEPDATPPKWKRWTTEALIWAILLLHACTSWYAIGQMKETRTDRLQTKACLAFFDLIEDPCQTQRLDWEPTLLKQRVASLERLAFFHPPLLRSADLRPLAGSTDPASKQFGVFDSLTNVGIGFYRASGWATLPERGEPADAVVLTYLRADGAPVAFALADWIQVSSGWEKWFELPAGADRVQAWAYDALAGRAYLLFGEQRTSNAPTMSVRFVPQARGFVEAVDTGEMVTAKGWAVLLSRHKPADMVLLTCGGSDAILAAGQPWAIRPDVVRELRDPRYLKSSWQVPVHRERVPPGCEFKAWAYDNATNEAGLLPDLHP
jgi:hypothetical protein